MNLGQFNDKERSSSDSNAETRNDIEPEYEPWFKDGECVAAFNRLPDCHSWNVIICGMVLFMLVYAIVDLQLPQDLYLHIGYDVVYLFHVGCIIFAVARLLSNEEFTLSMRVAFLMDLLSYLHHAIMIKQQKLLMLACYYLRLHRPFRYIYKVDKDCMQGSLIITALKIIYTCMVVRITCAYVWLHIDTFEERLEPSDGRRIMQSAMLSELTNRTEVVYLNNTARRFFVALYIINKMFIPIGPSMGPSNDMERVAFLVVMLIGCLAVTGAAVASLSAVIGIHMRPEENFRTRYRLIMQDMTKSHIPPRIRNKVETFYKMYWHKQRAVSATQLLPIFPPVLPKSVHTDIYFEATQKSGLLCDLSYQFLSELAEKMETVHFIPGDAIIKRNSKKDAIVYIVCGDIEMLTAEDDVSPILRFTRGTILTPYGACAAGGGRAHVEVRAATFCTAHVLRADALWRVAAKHGRDSGQNNVMHAALNGHLERVRIHHLERPGRIRTKFKSSIVNLKRSLTELKEARDADGNLLLSRTDYFIEISGCYLMRNRADASLADDADPICLRQTFPCILQPTSSLLTAWNWTVALLILVICFTYPYYLVFRKDIPLEFYFFDTMMTAVYVLDIVTFLSTGANVEDGVPITFLQTSSVQVHSYWFVLDVLATVPIFMFIFEGKFNGINKILRLPKVFHMTKALEGEYVYHSNVIRFLSYTLLLIIACYLFAAVQQAFMCFQYGYCIVSNFTHQPYWTQAPMEDYTVLDRLTFGLYWATSLITFTVHLETWGVENLSNALYTMLALEVAIVLHIFIEAVYSATIMVSNAFREDYDGCIASVQNFLVRNEVDPLLQNRFITYLELCWYTDKAYSLTMKHSSVFYDLPSHVNHDILSRQRSKYILCIPFMKLLHKEDLKNISSEARMFCSSPNEILLNTGDISNEMYVIRQGMCQILSPDTKSVIGTLGAKSHFGVLECLFRLPAFYTVRAITHVQLFSISRKHLGRAEQLPQIKDAMDYAKEQTEYSRLQVRREPFVFYKPPAPAPRRQRFRLPRKHETDYDFLHPFKKLAFFSFLRYVFPRYTFRPDATFLTRYELFRASCALATALLFPSYTYMVLQWPWLYLITLLLDLFAFADTFFRMLVGYFNENGVLVYHPASTAAHYMRGAYLLDLFSCLPLEHLEVANRYTYGEYHQVTMARQLLMLNRILQLYRLPGALAVITSRMERQDFILVVKTLPLFLMVLHVLTSLLVLSSARIYGGAEEGRWLILPLDDPGGSWIHLFSDTFRFNMTASPWNLHLTCYFWIVYESTTTGYNNLCPSNRMIISVLFVSMILGAMFMTYVSVRIISSRANVNKVLAAYQENMKDLVQFMQRERLSTSLQRELMEYYEYYWDKTGGVDYRHVLKLCDQITLRTDAILHIYGPVFAKCPILSHCDGSLLRILGRAVRSVYFLKNTIIVEENDVVEDLYFVGSGRLQVRTTLKDISTLKMLSIGSVFGNLDAEAGTTLPAAVCAKSDVHLLQMNCTAFQHIVKDCDFPTVLELMKKYRKDNEMYIQGGVREVAATPIRYRGLSSPIMVRGRRHIVKYLHINNCLVQIYLIIISMLCVYTDMYNIGYQNNSAALVTALYVFDLGFCVKILLNCLLSHVVEDETDVKIMVTKIQQKYFKGEFKYDLMSLVPIELVSYAVSHNHALIFSWLRLNRMLRIITIYSGMKVFRDQATHNVVLSACTLVVWFTLFVHASACLWYFIGLTECAAQPATCWFYGNDGNNLCHNEYICSLYFILTTFSQNGVGDIMPKKQSEVLFVSLLQVLTTMVYMVYVGEFTNIIQYASFRSFNYYCNFLELQKFLKNNRVSAALVRLVNRYSVHLWREARGQQLPHFLVKAPRCLKLKVMAAVYMADLKRHPVFLECEPAMLRQLVGHLRQYYYDEDMFVVKEMEITDSMYLVHSGRVEEISEAQGEVDVPKIYNAGEYFGVGLVRNQPFPYSYRTLTKSQVLTLRLDDWEHLLKYFPASKNSINKYQQFKPDDDTGRRETTKITWDDSQIPETSKYPPPGGPIGGLFDGGEPSSPSTLRPSLGRTSGTSRKKSVSGSQKSSAGTPRISLGGLLQREHITKISEANECLFDSHYDQHSVSELDERSSSQVLFDKIAQDAASNDSDVLDDISVTTLQNRVIPLDQQSVEDYLRDKYKMREPLDIYKSRKSSATEPVYDDESEDSEAKQESDERRELHVRYKDTDVESKRDSTLGNEFRKDLLLHRRLTLSPELRNTPELRNQYALDSDVVINAGIDSASDEIGSLSSSNSLSHTHSHVEVDLSGVPNQSEEDLVRNNANTTISQSTNLLALEHLESVERSHDAPSEEANMKEVQQQVESPPDDEETRPEAARKERKSLEVHKERKVSFDELDTVIYKELEKKLSKIESVPDAFDSDSPSTSKENDAMVEDQSDLDKPPTSKVLEEKPLNVEGDDEDGSTSSNKDNKK